MSSKTPDKVRHVLKNKPQPKTPKRVPSKPLPQTLDSLQGKTIDPKRLELGWTSTSDDDGHGIHGVVNAGRRLGQEDLIEEGCMDFAGEGMPVMIRATIRTDPQFSIQEIQIDAYGACKAANGPPIECQVQSHDEQLLATEIARFLKEPVFTGANIAEDAAWLHETAKEYQTLVRQTGTLGKLDCVNRIFKLARAKALGWEVDRELGTCFGWFELITDCDCGDNHYLGILVRLTPALAVESVTSDFTTARLPTKHDIEERDSCFPLDGFNYARFIKCLEAITAA